MSTVLSLRGNVRQADRLKHSPVSMDTRLLTFRVRNIPLEYDEDNLKDALWQKFTTDERISILPVASLVPSFRPEAQTQDALLTFHPKTPAFLDEVLKDKTRMTEYQIHVDGRVINIDLNFFGLTQVSSVPRDGEIDMDLVFVTGLDGNAFGSWASRRTGLMWPREFLRDDLPNARVLTFGYNTKLSSNMSHTFGDYVSQFLSTLQLARKKSINRPLVLIGHSYGARVIVKSILKCKILDGNEFNKGTLESLKLLVFFGAPHHGMDVEDIKFYLDEAFRDQPRGSGRKALVDELRRNNPAVARDLQDFKDLLAQELKIKIISVYERKPGHRLIQTPIPSSGPSKAKTHAEVTWQRKGDTYIPLTKEDAVFRLPAWLELQLPSDSDHSNMTKFDHKDMTYQLIAEELQKFMAKPVSLGSSFKPDRTETTMLKLSQLQSSLRGFKDQEMQQLNKLTLDLLTSLGESQVLLDVAEELCSRAIVWRPKFHFTRIAMAIQDDMRNLQVAIRPFHAPLFNHGDSLTDMLLIHADGLTHLLQRSLRFNYYLKIILVEEIPRILGQQFDSRKRLDELILLRFAGDIRLSAPDGIPDSEKVEHIPLDRLYFPAKPEHEQGHETESWMENIEFLSGTATSGLHLQPRRYAALRMNNKFEKVMVEFHPCRASALDSAVETCSIISESNRSPTLWLRSIPLLGWSYTEAFQSHLTIYDANSLLGLDETFEKFDVPSVKDRIWLAVKYARSISTLHSACLCHGLFNPFNLYLRFPSRHEEDSPASKRPRESSRSSKGKNKKNKSHILNSRSTTPVVAGFDIVRGAHCARARYDIDDPHWRIHMHPQRMERPNSGRHDPRYDVFSLGMVMIEIGIWMLFGRSKNYPKKDIRAQQAYCIKLAEQFQGKGVNHNMPAAYKDIVYYCLGRGDNLPGQCLDEEQRRLLSGMEEPKAWRVVDALTYLYENLS